MSYTTGPEFLSEDFLQMLIGLATYPDSLCDGRDSDRGNHSLLECHFIARMNTSVQYIEEGNGHYEGLLNPSLSP